MASKCPKCHFENPDTSRYCSECGTQLIPSDNFPSATKTLDTRVQELTRGTVFANRYEIIEELGRGGMGKIYKAHDTEIKDTVALKLIKPEISSDENTIERFRNEIKTTRKIMHKNIGRMYDLGRVENTYFIAMEYVSGEDLKSFIKRSGRLDIPKAISIAKQVCEGLAEAHSLGVVHRDLKPGNIMIDKEGNARIMDFGIARSLKEKGITGAGVVIGTPDYMSPEQAEAKELDQRSDIYSLGLILYEMVTGRLPFEGDAALSLALKHTTEAPKPPKQFNPQIPNDLNNLILKCLDKDKQKRYQTVQDVRNDLENIEKDLPTLDRIVPDEKRETSKEITVSFRLRKLFIPALIIIALAITAVVIWQLQPQEDAAVSVKENPSIAVLPFEDFSPQKDQEILCDGMTDEIIVKLSSLQGWRVVNRKSMMRFKNTERDIQDIGQELDVKTVLLGTVRKEGDDIRVTVQLVNVADRFPVWSEAYNQKLEKIFDIQTDIAERIAKSLQAAISPEESEKLQKKNTENLEAYRLYLKGRWFWDKGGEENLNQAIDCYKQALEIEPNYAKAYAGIADAYSDLPYFSSIPTREALESAEMAVLKALELDNMCAEAYNSLAAVKAGIEYDWEGAERDYLKSIELNPGYATAHYWYAYQLSCLGKHDEALAEIEQALDLDPLSYSINEIAGVLLYWSRKYDQAIRQFKTTLELYPDLYEPYYYLGLVYIQEKKYEEAISEMKKAVALEEDSPQIKAWLGYAYAASGSEVRAVKILDELKDSSKYKYISPGLIASIHIALGQKDHAFLWLEKAYADVITI